MTEIEFNNIRDAVIEAGYEEEIEWARNIEECSNDVDFAYETIWVILNSGMKEQISRIIWNRIQEAWNKGEPTITVFKHKGKVAAIDKVWNERNVLFEKYVLSEDKLAFLKTIPFIGKITVYHLAKNLGFDCCKPDRHLVRVADKYKLTPDELCKRLSEKTGEKIRTIDTIIWRACNLKLL